MSSDDRYTFATALGRIRIERILEALKIAPMTAVQLADDLHMGATTARTAIRHLMGEEPRRIYVKDWPLVGANYTPLYALGDLPDAPRPTRMTRKAKHQLYMLRLRNDPDQRDRYLAKKRAHDMQPRRDPLTAWIPVRNAA
jgi:hypothetical protein